MADDGTDVHFEAADEEHIRRERSKARALRQSPWWKNRLGQGQCYYCQRRVHPQELTMDHIVPLVRGGYSKRGNVVPCCKECNNRKKHLLPVEWAAHLERLRGGARGAGAR
jgi:5-methylcytosine-specific restriction endonuclease McrA